MLNVEEALDRLLHYAKPINEFETCTLKNASGRVLAENLHSTIDVPPADNSAMDGYAIHTSDLIGDGPTRFPISQTVTAGDMPKPLEKATAARIFTGAEIPEGANAVVMQEACETQGKAVLISSQVPAGNNIRRRGQDIQSHTIIAQQGKLLRPQDCGLLASIGLASIPVYRNCRVALLSSGNELIEPGTTLKKGQIYNSNRYFLYALLIQLGCEVIDLGVIPDKLETTVQALQKASASDCIISTGGVSVGEEDHIKHALSTLGKIDFWRIALKPGKPLAFGHIGTTPFFGLPGNPVSSFLTFCLFVIPFLAIRRGGQYQAPPRLRYRVAFSQKANPKRQEYLRVTICHNTASVHAFPNQSSGVLSSITESDGLAIIPVNTELKAGDVVDVIPFIHFFN